MAVWKFIIKDENGEPLYSDCGFETEQDAEEEAKKIRSERFSKEAAIEVLQIWQELEYETPRQVVFFETQLQEYHGGIAYRDEVICADCGSVFELSEVEIVKELPWISIEEALYGDPLCLLLEQ